MAYDPDNIFAKILRGEMPCDKVREDEHTLALRDINPRAPVHVLVIPKGPYQSFDDFARDADAAEQAAIVRAVGEIARAENIADSGYRVIVNHGRDGKQEVPHLHFHLLGGRGLGEML